MKVQHNQLGTKILPPILTAILLIFFAIPSSVSAFVISSGGKCCPNPTAECCDNQYRCSGGECGPEEISPAPGACSITDADRNNELLGEMSSTCLTTGGETVSDPEPTATTTGEIAGRVAGPPIEPRLAINIPTVSLSDIQVSQSNGYNVIDIPWLADYVAGVYRYAVFLGSIIAAVMIMIGGISWLTAGGNTSRVSSAKKRISDATVAMALILGSYLLLYTVNPALTSLQPLRVKTVRPDPIQFELMTTTAATVDDSGGGASSTGGGSSGFGGVTEPIAGSYTQSITSCPVTLAAEPSRTLPTSAGRAQQFARAIGAQITTTDVRQRAIQIAEAAVVCESFFGSCGRTVGTIYALAGVSVGDGAGDNVACITASSNACAGGWGALAGNSGVNRADLETYRCCLSSDSDACTGRRPQSNCPNAGCSNSSRPGCGADSRAATAVARDRIESDPDTLANLLEPGDIMIVYNGNSSPRGTHSAMFLGWASGGRAQVIQGDVRRLTSYGSICVRSECGDRRQPLLWVHKPVCQNLRGNRCLDTYGTTAEQ